MRADRLIALLMLLQARGRMTARDLARELEVSERTIYRDIEALGSAGVPVCAERGPGGGCGLIEGYRTTLTGLTQDEARALFAVSVPESLDHLGISADLRSALRKLAASLPRGLAGDGEMTRQRVHVDSRWWAEEDAADSQIRTLYRALWEDRMLRVVVRRVNLPLAARHVEMTIAPLGLVSETGVWHFVFARSGRLGVCRVSDLLGVEPADERFARPPAFDLAAFWRARRTEHERRRPRIRVRVRVAPGAVAYLPLYFDERVRGQLPSVATVSDRPVELSLEFESFEEARGKLLALGGAVEVLDPPALRLSVADHARQAARVYEP